MKSYYKKVMAYLYIMMFWIQICLMILSKIMKMKNGLNIPKMMVNRHTKIYKKNTTLFEIA